MASALELPVSRLDAALAESCVAKALSHLSVETTRGYRSDWNYEASRNVIQRARRKNPHLRLDKSNVAYALKPEDVMPVLYCSRRTAIDYIQTLKWLCD